MDMIKMNPSSPAVTQSSHNTNQDPALHQASSSNYQYASISNYQNELQHHHQQQQPQQPQQIYHPQVQSQSQSQSCPAQGISLSGLQLPANLDLDQNDLTQMLKIFQKYNLKESEEIFKRELNKKAGIVDVQDPSQKEKDFYFDIFDSLIKFVDSAKDNKHELSQVFYPIFVHLYMDMISKEYVRFAQDFFFKYSNTLSNIHAVDLKKFKLITTKDQLDKSDLREAYRSTKYNIKLAEESYRMLKEFVKNKNSKQLIDLIKENIMIEIYNGPLREFKQQNVTSGGLLGETNSNNNTARIFYGLLKEPEFNMPDEGDEMMGDGDESEKPKKRKNKKDAMMNKKNRQDPNAPQFTRIPLPEVRDVDRNNRQQAMRDYIKRARLSAEKLPSICFYTILNSYNLVNCCDMSDDSAWLALGLADSSVRVCSLNDKVKLKILKPIQDLELLDKESDDVINLMFDENSGVDHRTLTGHSGPVFGVCFSCDKNFLVSGSEDGTVRLWCLLTYTCLVSYKGHNGPVWDVKFGPYGHYFASCGMDRTARVWASDQYQSLKLYADHLSDVECICFHPNSNYLATGSNDRIVRIYDLASLAENQQVRQYTGHKDSINVLKFSACGRYLVSGGLDAFIYIWDIATSVLVANLTSHNDSIYSIDFSRDNTVFTTGGLDNSIKLWNMSKLIKDIEQTDDMSKFVTRNESQLQIGSWRTKQTPVIHLHFTRRNVLVGIGPFRNPNTPTI